MPSSQQYYAYGYSRKVDIDEKTSERPDAEVIQLLNDLNKGVVTYDAWEFKERVMLAAKRLFTSFPEWLDLQDKNERVVKHGYEFIKDTIEFINTGKRSVSIATRISLVKANAVTDNYENPRFGVRPPLRNLLAVNDTLIIATWLRHKGGFEDMLCTLKYIFGTEVR